jgi:hypothetical protein
MKTVSEYTDATLTLTFSDENGLAVTPNSGRYAVFDGGTEEMLVPWTAFTPAAATFDISIGGYYNRILDVDNESEIRVVSVELVYGSKRAMGEYEYAVANLKHIPPSYLITSSKGAVFGGTASIVGNEVVIQ